MTKIEGTLDGLPCGAEAGMKLLFNLPQFSQMSIIWAFTTQTDSFSIKH